jgi:hypothetical protein
MAAPNKATNPTANSRELASLKQRVKWLEAALRPKRRKPAVDPEVASKESPERP